jgi:hypothetical protein
MISVSVACTVDSACDKLSSVCGRGISLGAENGVLVFDGIITGVMKASR